MHFDALAFAGCGTLNFYQTGVGYALQRHGLSDELHYAGASAGSGLSVLLASGVDAREIFRVASELLRPHQGENIALKPLLLKSFIDQFLEIFINQSTLEAIGDRVHISITKLTPWSNLLVNEFTSVDDLCQAIRASCHIPSLRFPSTTFRGARCIDGGFSRNNPHIGQRCVRVSPFFFDLRMKIRPRSLTPPWWTVIVPSPERALDLFERGAQDGARYLNQDLRGSGFTVVDGVLKTNCDD